MAVTDFCTIGKAFVRLPATPEQYSHCLPLLFSSADQSQRNILRLRNALTSPKHSIEFGAVCDSDDNGIFLRALGVHESENP